jgi:hypothetical protein
VGAAEAFDDKTKLNVGKGVGTELIEEDVWDMLVLVAMEEMIGDVAVAEGEVTIEL